MDCHGNQIWTVFRSSMNCRRCYKLWINCENGNDTEWAETVEFCVRQFTRDTDTRGRSSVTWLDEAGGNRDPSKYEAIWTCVCWQAYTTAVLVLCVDGQRKHVQRVWCEPGRVLSWLCLYRIYSWTFRNRLRDRPKAYLLACGQCLVLLHKH